jgi:hypothetical protein
VGTEVDGTAVGFAVGLLTTALPTTTLVNEGDSLVLVVVETAV